MAAREFPQGKDLPNMNTFCDWLPETILISVYDSFFNHSACSYRYVATLPYARLYHHVAMFLKGEIESLNS